MKNRIGSFVGHCKITSSIPGQGLKLWIEEDLQCINRPTQRPQKKFANQRWMGKVAGRRVARRDGTNHSNKLANRMRFVTFLPHSHCTFREHSDWFFPEQIRLKIGGQYRFLVLLTLRALSGKCCFTFNTASSACNP